MAHQEIHVPDLEGTTDVAVVEVYVEKGEHVEVEAPLISLESDKAVMDVPSPVAGTIVEMKISEGDTVNQGDLLAIVDVADSAGDEETSSEVQIDPAPEAVAEKKDDLAPKEPEDKAKPAPNAAPEPRVVQETPLNSPQPGSIHHATPSLRAFARELGVDLSQVTGTGPKGRITREDVTSWTKKALQSGSPSATSFSLPSIPTADFAAFGEVEQVDLSRIKKISGPHLHRNWLGVPHVTQFEEADITELEAFRKALNAENRGVKISPLIFVLKAVSAALKEFPDFNASLTPEGTGLIRKKYVHIGIAVDTPGGLVVPVLRDVDRKGVDQLAQELGELSLQAREGKLKAKDMQGAGFTISSLGGIGGTAFTPIVNAPEAAILGLSRSSMKPIWNGSEFIPRLMLPLSLSYDHRVIDGAQGARFVVRLAQLIADIRRILL